MAIDIIYLSLLLATIMYLYILIDAMQLRSELHPLASLLKDAMGDLRRALELMENSIDLLSIFIYTYIDF